MYPQNAGGRLCFYGSLNPFLSTVWILDRCAIIFHTPAVPSPGLHAPEFIAALYDSVRFAEAVNEAQRQGHVFFQWLDNSWFVEDRTWKMWPDFLADNRTLSQVRLERGSEFIIKYDNVLSGVEAGSRIRCFLEIKSLRLAWLGYVKIFRPSGGMAIPFVVVSTLMFHACIYLYCI